MLIPSTDRKVATQLIATGKSLRPVIANTFGLPAGSEYSCPGQTSVCGSICYASKLEKVYKGVREVLLRNWETLQALGDDVDALAAEIDLMLANFVAQCNLYRQQKLFRIHWDGDFYSPEYAQAWRQVVVKYSDVQFWVYTRAAFAVPILRDIPNLSLYFSADKDNLRVALALHRTYKVKLAYLDEDFDSGNAALKEHDIKAAKCPENAGKIPLATPEAGACVSCGWCIDNKAHILFSKKKTRYKEDK